MNGEEYGRLVWQHKDRVHTYAVWMLGDREDALDVAQEALLRLWQNRHAVCNGASRAWLLKTTHRLCIDRIRRRTTQPRVSLADLAARRPDHRPGPEHGAMMTDLRGAVSAALETLNPRDRAVILLRESHGMSYQEMAEVMEMPLGTLKATLFRARERLRDALLGAGVCP